MIGSDLPNKQKGKKKERKTGCMTRKSKISGALYVVNKGLKIEIFKI